MQRREFVTGILAAGASVLGSHAWGATAVQTEFLLFGRSSRFATHRLRYAAGHNFQLALRLADPLGLPQGLRRALSAGRPLLLRSTALDLRGLRPGSQSLRALTATVHDLQGELVWVSRDWPVRAVYVYAQVDVQQARGRQLEYYRFGHGREHYAMHRVGGAPDFEHIVRLPGLPDEERLLLAQDNDADVARAAWPKRDQLHFSLLTET